MSEYKTEQKKLLLDFLEQNSDKSYTIDELVASLEASAGEAAPGKSTVYRIISELTSKGIIKKLSDPNSRHVRYQYLGERSCGEHLHLKCKSCDRLIHLDKSTSELVMNYIQRADSFTLDPTEILSGLCSLCKEQGKEN